MLEDIEGLQSLSETRKEGISSSHIDYLSELNAPDIDWAERNETQQSITLSAIDGRMDELGVAVPERSELAHSVFSDDLADAYDDYIVELYNNSSYERIELNEHIEAPHDNVQIEQISELLENCEEIKYENWVSLELSERLDVLNSLEERIAEIEHRPVCPVYLMELPENHLGGYNTMTKDITLNSSFVERSDYYSYHEVLDTLIHEGRHAYQDYNVNVAEIHPRHSEVASWAETMEGGKWGYWGDCSSLLGQRLYEQQSIEIDARNFAADVLDKLNLNA